MNCSWGTCAAILVVRRASGHRRGSALDGTRRWRWRWGWQRRGRAWTWGRCHSTGAPLASAFWNAEAGATVLVVGRAARNGGGFAYDDGSRCCWGRWRTGRWLISTWTPLAGAFWHAQAGTAIHLAVLKKRLFGRDVKWQSVSSIRSRKIQSPSAKKNHMNVAMRSSRKASYHLMILLSPCRWVYHKDLSCLQPSHIAGRATNHRWRSAVDLSHRRSGWGRQGRVRWLWMHWRWGISSSSSNFWVISTVRLDIYVAVLENKHGWENENDDWKHPGFVCWMLLHRWFDGSRKRKQTHSFRNLSPPHASVVTPGHHWHVAWGTQRHVPQST